MELMSIMTLGISSLATIVAIVGIGWFGLDRMRKDLKEDSQRAHDVIGKNIEVLRREIREDVNTLRNEVSELRREMTNLTGRVRRIEGFLEMTDS